MQETMESPVSAKYALLEALVRGEGYGLDLIDRVRERTKGALELGQGSVYPALRSLERDGFVESRESDPLPERGGRRRRYYKITAAGFSSLQERRDVVAAVLGETTAGGMHG